MDALEVVFDGRVYRLAAIKKAAYKFGDRFAVEIETMPGERVRVRLHPSIQGPQVDAALAEFRNEVLDQELREVVASETAPVRDLLLAHAFSKTNLIQPEMDQADYQDDPAGIGQRQ